MRDLRQAQEEGSRIVIPPQDGIQWFTVLSRPSYFRKKTLLRRGFQFPLERRLVLCVFPAKAGTHCATGLAMRSR